MLGRDSLRSVCYIGIENTSKGVEKAAKSIKNIKSAYVQSQSVTVEDGKVDEYRVNLKVTFAVK